MTLAEYRGRRPPAGHEEKAAAIEIRREPAAAPERVHPAPLQYAEIGLLLASVTMVEVAVYYIHALHDVLVPILMVLSATKFSLVALWFMHLRFDNRVFSILFIAGLMLVVALFLVVLASLGASLV